MNVRKVKSYLLNEIFKNACKSSIFIILLWMTVVFVIWEYSAYHLARVRVIDGLTLELDDPIQMQRLIAELDQLKNNIMIRLLGSMVMLGLFLYLYFRAKNLRTRKRDHLTGLLNRDGARNLLQELLQNVDEGQSIAVIMVHIDHLRRVQDLYSMGYAEQILNEISDRMKYCVGHRGTVARIDDYKFTLILHQGTDQQEIDRILLLLQKLLQKPIHVHNHVLPFTYHIGVSTSQEAADAEQMFRNAALAGEDAASIGPNEVQIYSEKIQATWDRAMLIEQELHHALEREEFALYYQPQHQVLSGGLKGFEALIRWQNEKLGQVSPAEFIPIAEKIGLIHAIGDWVLIEACKTNTRWQAVYGIELVMAINISAIQLEADSFMQRLQWIIAYTGLAPKYMELEITESSVIDTLETASQHVHQIAQMGVNVALDDFGTGYSSLSYLKKLPVHTLKLDKSFIQTLLHESKQTVLTRALISLAHELGMQVVAEGIESKATLAMMRKWNCDFVQGYYLSRPLSQQQAENYLRTQM